MMIDIHKVITGNPITKNLMKPWSSNKEKTIFNKYTGPGNDLKQQLDFNPYTGEIYKVHDQPSSSNDRCLNIQLPKMLERIIKISND